MFLSKVGNVYYLFFSDESGARQKVSTKCRKKSEAFAFLQQFKRNEFEKLTVFFTESDFQLLLSVIEDRDFKELCIAALLSGLRLGELLALRWDDIDFTTKVILVKNSETFTTKTRKNRIVPMSEELFRLLKERKEKIRFECEIVFHYRYGG